jgi:hypothetical protein
MIVAEELDFGQILGESHGKMTLPPSDGVS